MHQGWKKFIIGIVSPAVLALVLFATGLFAVFLPATKKAIVERKREMLRELTASAWSILAECERLERTGHLTRPAAQQLALDQVRHLRYGREGKDYFWITDLQPRMLMHPYRTDLEGSDLSDYRDADGRRLFVEFVRVARTAGNGYVSYVWQWKDDPSRMAPKLSYVKLFAPWNWIIGTGLYVDDVQAEVHHLTMRLAYLSLGIVGLTSLLLLLVAWQSYRFERRRRQAEWALRQSERQYRLLVESAAEGILMVAAGRIVFANQPLLIMLNLPEQALQDRPLRDLFDPTEPGYRAVAAWLEGREAPDHFSAGIVGPSGRRIAVAAAVVKLTQAGEGNLLISLREVRLPSDTAVEAAVSRPFAALFAWPGCGFFRATLARRPRLLEASPGCLNLLGLADPEALTRLALADLIPSAGERKRLFRRLLADREVRDALISLRRADGTRATVAVCALLIDAATGLCEGFLRDVTAVEQTHAVRDRLTAELQSSWLYLTAPARAFMRPAASCTLDTPVREAAAVLARQEAAALLVRTPEGTPIGILTNADMCRRVVAAGLAGDQRAAQVMTAPLITLPGQALVGEALRLMDTRGVAQVALRDATGGIEGFLHRDDLLNIQGAGVPALLQAIASAASAADLRRLHARLPTTVKLLMDCGVRAGQINGWLAAVSDAMTVRVIELAVAEIGAPPVPCAFLALGSEGRREQTLATDQDNALIYADTDDADGALERYFGQLAQRVCEALNASGYAYCRGDVMARNRAWCQPLRRWRMQFTDWIEHAAPDALQAVNIVFDFRAVHGETGLADQLRAHVQAAVREKPIFFYNLARSTLDYKPPLGLLGRIVLEGNKAHPGTFDIKQASVPIVNFARVYALHGGIAATGTPERLAALAAAGTLTPESARELTEAGEWLMQIRLQHQADQLRHGTPPDNHIGLAELSPIQRGIVRQIFEQITVFQDKLRLDFTHSF